MQTRVRIFNRQGIPIGEVASPNVTRSWVLNEPGIAAFFLPRVDAAFDKDTFAFGNLLLVEHDRAGAWVGVLWPSPLAWQWTSSGVNVRAVGAESILRRRVSKAMLQAATMGAAFEAVIGDLNQVEDTLIRAGEVWHGGHSRSPDFRFRIAADKFARWARTGQIDWGIEPAVDPASGMLSLSASLVEQRGQVWDFALEEGKNVEWQADAAVLSEQGEIFNEVTVFESAANNDVRSFAVADDGLSRAAYGLSQMVQNGRDSLSQQASGLLAKHQRPRRTFRLAAIDVDNTFDYVGLGDTVWVRLPSVHWAGVHTRARVIAREFSDETGKMILTMDEVNTA